MTADAAIELVEVMCRNSIRELDIMGGEPFLLPWLNDLLAAASLNEITVNISTNGSVIRPLAGLTGKSGKGLTVGISLEGSTAGLHERITGAGHFTTAMAALRALADSGLDPVVKTVVNRETAGDIQNIIGLIRELGISKYYLIHMDLFSRDTRAADNAIGYTEFEAFAALIRKTNPELAVGTVTASCFNGTARTRGRRCAGGTSKIAVMPDGSVLPCNLFQGIPEFRLGNIFQNSLEDIMASPVLDYFRAFSGNNCSAPDCRNKDNCTGGCPAHGIYHYGKPDGPDIRCRL